MENNTSKTKMYWDDDFTISEPLHGAASSISGTYTRMSINFPENPLAKYWDEQALEWHRYYNNIGKGKLSFNTHEEGELEISRICKINREVLELEKQLREKHN